MKQSSSNPPTTRPWAPASPVRVLLLEPRGPDAELCMRALQDAKIEVQADQVQTPEEFTEMLKRNTYDIILADYRLPNWTGMDALKLLQESGQDIPMVLVTGTMGEEAAVDCIKQGFTDYVLKDRMRRLPVAVQRALEEKALRDERGRTEQALRDSEVSFRMLFAANPLPMWVYDAGTWQFLQVNDAAVAQYGYSREEFLQKRITDIAPAEEIPRLLEFLQEKPPLVLFNGQWRHRLQDGRIIDVEVASHALQYASREAALVIAQDITERKRAEEALRYSEFRYRELVENALYGIYRATPAGQLLDANPALVEMLGYDSKSELLHQSVATGLYPDPVVRAQILRQFRDSGRLTGAEVEWKRKDGAIITVRLSGRAIFNAHGRPEEIEVFVEDVTQRRALEKHLRQLQKFEAIGQLAGGIAHDFNNVMGAIMGWAELGRDQSPPDNALHNHFCKIREQTERATGLTRQLLAFARRQLLEPRNLNLNQIVTETLGLLEKVIGKDIEMKAALAPDLHAARADPTQIEQVVMNLCLNARDAMPRGGRMTVETENAELGEDYYRNHSYARPGRYVRLTVSDTGQGMDAATLEHIFDPFFTTKEPGKGTGLGLATVYGVVKQHGGFLHVYSEPGQGTAFHIYLPAATEPIPEAEKKARLENEPVRGGSETILVAEDHDGVREMARMTLESFGYRLLLARDGTEALELFHAHHQAIALALLDVIMPKLGGPEAYLRMCAERPGLPVVFTTGYSAEAAPLGALLAEGAVVLQKPYSPSVLGRKVREILDNLSPTIPHSTSAAGEEA